MLINFLKSHLGRNGVPLNYSVHDNFNPIVSNNTNLLDDYYNRTLLQGRVFTHDASKFHLYIISLISENTVDEQKIFPYNDNVNVQEEFLALKDFYKGVGTNSKATISADNDIQELFYTGEKKPHVWWDESEIRLNNSFAIIDKDAGRQIHTNESKLRLLNKNIRAKFLTTKTMTIGMQMSIITMNIAYFSELSKYRNTVNQILFNESSVKSNNIRI